MMRRVILLAVALVSVLFDEKVQAFVPASSVPQTNRASFSLLPLFAKKRKGKLASSIVSDGLAVTPSKALKRPRRPPPSDGNVSPSLLQWMESQGDDVPVGNDKASDNASKGGKTKSRRIRQSERQEIEAQRQLQVQLAVDNIQKTLEENKNNLQQILSSVTQLLALPNSSFRPILAGRKKSNYRLAWVGSDDAICHVGTGLHKVPLARLQEVFLSTLGGNRIEIVEVIRILGPFPNVKNMLQGSTNLLRDNDQDVEGINIEYDSMVDGTGKEVMAGTKDNVRRVALDIYFADERAIVAGVPPEAGLRAKPLENNGRDILVFLREDELEEKLDALRVS